MIRGAFTLAETLAAIALLAVLAAAAMPLTRRLAEGEEAIDARFRAREILRAVASVSLDVQPDLPVVDGHPAWQIRREPMSVEAGSTLMPVRWWWRIAVVDTSRGDRVLAETLVTGPAP